MYKIKIKKDSFFKEDKQSYYFDFKIEDDSLVYKTRSLPKDNEYEILRNYKKDVLNVIKRNIGLLLGIIVFCFLILYNSMIIKEIVFTNEKDYQIEEYLNTHISNRMLKTDILEINHEMKKIFTTYEWISVTKIGNNLIVETKYAPDYQKVYLNDTLGDFYAEQQGLIKFFQVEKGLPLIEYNQFITEGQLLVSGNLNHNTEKEENLVPPRGIIIAEVFDIEEVVIPKKEEIIKYTGRIEKKRYAKVMNNIFKNIDTKYLEYEKTISNKFNFFNFFVIEEVKYLQKSVIMNTYDFKTANEMAESQICYNYYLDFKHEKEDIKEVILLTSIERETDYQFKFVVKKWKNITKFIAR